MNEIWINVAGGLITLAIGYIMNQIFVVQRLESKNEILDARIGQQQKEIDDLKLKLNDEFLYKLDKLDEKFQKVTIEVARLSERIENMTRRSV